MKIKTFLILFLILFLLTSCITKIDVNKVREFADPIVENLLISRNEKDYERYSKDFSDEMKRVVTKEKFLESINLIEGKIGKYIVGSKELYAAIKQKNYIIVTYKAKFTNETSDVIIRIVFEEINGEMKVSGEWFDSPKLRK
ncbi:MAG: DUF3887 domain-containing protein [Caldisericia bacterium]|jgi:hypothetical protein|nr:DUF3887 domain-containing protein [Caldisericia bacterium]